MERLELLQQYLTEAELDADNNKLYIEDLKLSIDYQKSILGPIKVIPKIAASKVITNLGTALQ